MNILKRFFFYSSTSLFLIIIFFPCQNDVSNQRKLPEAVFATSTLPPSPLWEIPDDSVLARTNPDKFAWLLFVALNWTASVEQKKADTTKNIGDEGTVVWQTWKDALQVYPCDGSAPSPWDTTVVATKQRSAEKDFARFSIKSRLVDISKDPTFGLEEVKMNKATFDYIVANELYNIDGQLVKYQKNEPVNFPKYSIEIKVKWRQIPDTKEQKARYHWEYVSEEQSDGNIKPVLYGLVSMHVISKVLPNYLWATFEHIDSKGQTHAGDDGWLLPSKDRFACSNPPYDCGSIPMGLKLEGTKWQYFRLRGTQIDYLDENGLPTLLANSQIERGFQPSSSCITCHSLSSIAPTEKFKDANRIDFLPQGSPMRAAGFGGRGYVGVPDPKLFQLPDGKKYMPLDFLWSLSRANWKNNPNPSNCQD
ncbi:MAG: hypothetical protein MUE81_17460 [Thermoflexibacter sp.]|nr:hypothetical protein [Thermoflexibacter sp.]